jgi:hypothetical protein
LLLPRSLVLLLRNGQVVLLWALQQLRPCRQEV